MLKELVAELSVFSLNISVLGEDWQERKAGARLRAHPIGKLLPHHV